MVNPAFSNSFTPLGYSLLEREVWCTMSYVTTLITASGISSTFSWVCLVAFVFPLLAGEKTAMGGFVLKRLKKLKGLRLGVPFLSSVLTKATGLGATACDKYACKTVV